MADRIVPISGKASPLIGTDGETRLVEELARKVRAYIEENDALPEVVTLVLYGVQEDTFNYASGYFAPAHRSKTECYGTSIGILVKTM